MIETRAVRSDELDAMLSLMCDAFGLPFAAARDLFYKDPYFDVDKKRVLLVDGKLASCLTIVEAPMWFGAAPVHVAGIAGVATAPQHRRKGYASRLLLDTLPAIREMGCSFAALFPFSYDYYRKLGWARVGSQMAIRAQRAALPAFRESRHVRPASPADRADMARLYDLESRGQSGRWIRDTQRWTYLLEHAKRHIVYRRAHFGGYALFETRDEPDGARTARILELMADSEEARRGLIGYFAGMKEVQTVCYTVAASDRALIDLTAQTEFGPGDPPSMAIEPGVMFRIVDLPAALSELSPNLAGARGEFVFTMTDPNAPREWPRGALMTGTATGVTIEPLAAGDRRLRSPERIDGDVRAWTQVLTGYYSLEDALSLNLLHRFGRVAGRLADSDREEDELFPRRDLFVPPADHF